MKNKQIRVIEFSGESCANCYSLLPTLTSIMKNFNDAILQHIEITNETMEVVKKYDIDRVPTIIVFKGEEEVARCRGYQPEEILAIWLEAKIDEARKK